jgi:metallo-beta-lactamase superfamily protein
MNRMAVAILFLFLPLYCVADDLFDIKPVADGVYAAIAKPAFKVNCNAAIILLDDGRAHTDGDVFVFLPKEKVLVTGDALHGWTPYMGDSYPYDWIKTLDVAEKLDFEYAIGGHGEVMQGKQKFELWKQYLSDLLDQTAAAYANGATLDQAKKQVSDYLVSKYAANFDPKFPQSVGSNVIKAYQVIAFTP